VSRLSPASAAAAVREKELFAHRAQHVRALFRSLESMATGVNKEAGSQLIVVETALNPKNLGGIDVPDGARLVLKFLERRVEVVLSPLGQHRRAPRGHRRASDGVGHPVRPRRSRRVPTGTTCRCARTAPGWRSRPTASRLRRRSARRTCGACLEWLIG
jgi:hypothetical protein